MNRTKGNELVTSVLLKLLMDSTKIKNAQFEQPNPQGSTLSEYLEYLIANNTFEQLQQIIRVNNDPMITNLPWMKNYKGINEKQLKNNVDYKKEFLETLIIARFWYPMDVWEETQIKELERIEGEEADDNEEGIGVQRFVRPKKNNDMIVIPDERVTKITKHVGVKSNHPTRHRIKHGRGHMNEAMIELKASEYYYPIIAFIESNNNKKVSEAHLQYCYWSELEKHFEHQEVIIESHHYSLVSLYKKVLKEYMIEWKEKTDIDKTRPNKLYAYPIGIVENSKKVMRKVIENTGNSIKKLKINK